MAKNGGVTTPHQYAGGNNKGNRGNRRKQPGQNQYDYLQLPTNSQLHQETTAATNLAYRPTERSIAAEKRASQQRTKNIGTWWNEYLSQVQQGQQATAGAYAAANQQTQGLINTGSAVDSANTAGLNAQASQAAAARGQDASAANTATTSTANAAQATRNAGIASMGARTAGIGANQFAYLGEKKRIGAGQRVQSMTNQAKRTQKIEQDRTALRKERGEYATKTLGQKQAEAREILLKKQAFHLEKESAAAGAQAEAEKANQEYKEFLAEQGNKQAELELQREGNSIDRQNANTTKYKAHHEPPEGAKTPAEKREGQEGRANALSTVHAFIASHGYPKSPAARAELEREVAKESEVSPADAAWAVRRYLERNPNKKGVRDAAKETVNKVNGF